MCNNSFHYEVTKIKNGFLLSKSELTKNLEQIYYEDFSVLITDLIMLCVINLELVQSNANFENLKISIKND